MAKREILTEEEINRRLKNIDLELGKMPKLKAGDPRQAIKWDLACTKRRLKIKLSKLQGNSHTFQDELDLINSVGGKCNKCGDASNPTIDHIIPISKGGHDGVSNLQVLCGSCNSKKGGSYAK